MESSETARASRSEVERTRGARRGARGGGARRVALYLVTPVLVLLLCRVFVVEPFHIPSDSMRPTLEAGDSVLANKLAYRFGSPHAGDLAVFRAPSGEILAKRVVAVAGQRVEIRDGILFVDRRARREPYVDHSRVDGFFFGPIQVPPEAVFMLGDSRAVSEDSRDFGAIPLDDLIGRIELTLPSLGAVLGGDDEPQGLPATRGG
jgi:signal peptidase I